MKNVILKVLLISPVLFTFTASADTAIAGLYKGLDDEGNVISVYCNIAKPCVLTEDTVEFIDLDKEIVKVEELSVSEIFELKGEEHFRLRS